MFLSVNCEDEDRRGRERVNLLSHSPNEFTVYGALLLDTSLQPAESTVEVALHIRSEEDQPQATEQQQLNKEQLVVGLGTHSKTRVEERKSQSLLSCRKIKKKNKL
eukprot:TRINITY_DN536_c0_g1_i1.p1 TRINITY_DN536_c0_g1~~TRINITY_DN536_c0_g1_i1.p1  ORF type:complete len:106 (-),score=17.72 TRINITY_DN536_c0_g1_i1:62-379(-)